MAGSLAGWHDVLAAVFTHCTLADQPGGTFSYRRRRRRSGRGASQQASFRHSRRRSRPQSTHSPISGYRCYYRPRRSLSATFFDRFPEPDLFLSPPFCSFDTCLPAAIRCTPTALLHDKWLRFLDAFGRKFFFSSSSSSSGYCTDTERVRGFYIIRTYTLWFFDFFWIEML